MRNLKYYIIALLALYILAGCATTKFDVISKPGADLTNCDNILVCSNIPDAVFRADLESRFVDNFSKNSKKATEGTNAKSEVGFDYIIDIKTTSELHDEWLKWQLSLYYLALGIERDFGFCLWLPKGKMGKVVQINTLPKEECLRLVKDYEKANPAKT